MNSTYSFRSLANSQTTIPAVTLTFREYFKTTEEAVEKLKQKGYFVYSIEQVEGSTKLQNLPEAHPSLSKGYAVIFGNEVKGVKQNIVDMSDGCLEIPQFGTKHSLNVSVTAGIVVWEFAKLLKL